MTMDIHLQITLPDECVTPNVPRIKASFFNRKYRDIQTTPATPKVSHARVKVTTSTKSRLKRSAGSTKGSTRQQARSPYTGRTSRGRTSINEPFDPDFSTPRATRNLLTPPSTNCAKLGKNGRVTHLIYKPLELDNESSSESIDTRRKRTRIIYSPDSRSPLAIEAPTLVKAESESGVENLTEIKQQALVVEEEKLTNANESQTKSTVKMVNENGDKTETKSDVSDDEEPEIIEVQPDLPFIPGNCNIEEILRLFGKQELPTTSPLQSTRKSSLTS